MKQVLLTGAAGGIGEAFRKHAREQYQLRCFDRVPVAGEANAVVGNLTDLDALIKAAQGCEAVVHLGAKRDDADFMTTILPDNILGTYNVFEAARLAGVKRVILASTVQVESGYPDGAYVTPQMQPRPTNLYAVSKLFGEDMGWMYANVYGLSVICLRLGWVALPRDHAEILEDQDNLEVICSVRDCCEILCRAIDAAGVTYAVLPVFSRNAAKIRDLSLLEQVLGYAPQDDAYTMFAKS